MAVSIAALLLNLEANMLELRMMDSTLCKSRSHAWFMHDEAKLVQIAFQPFALRCSPTPMFSVILPTS